jgi:hypothetical protein
MARASATAENAAAAAIAALAGYVALFSTDPTTTGSSGEISGGTYARVAVAWGAASGGVVANTNAITINVPASTTVAYFGLLTAVTGGTYEVGGALSSSQTFNTAGTYTIAAGGLTITVS